jgi:hypothetical protein
MDRPLRDMLSNIGTDEDDGETRPRESLYFMGLARGR